MTTIWKYEILAGETKIDLPINAKVLDIQVHNNVPQMWVLIPNTENPKYQRVYKTFGTGFSIVETPQRLTYISTFQITENYDNTVWHVFEVR